MGYQCTEAVACLERALGILTAPLTGHRGDLAERIEITITEILDAVNCLSDDDNFSAR